MELAINSGIDVASSDAHAMRRLKILNEATKLFCTGGYSGTRMTDIAAAIGVTKPVIYRYYKSKEDLFESWLEYELIDARNRVISLISNPNSSAREITKQLSDSLLASLHTPVLMSPWRIALVEADSFPHITNMVCARFKEPILRQLDNMFEKAIKNGEIGGTKAANLTRLYLAPVASTAVLISTFGEEAFGDFSFKEMLECHLEAFWRAWGK